MKVILNFAISVDGKIGASSGGASKFTSKKDLERLWEIRKTADAIMVGRGTLEADHMTLTIPTEVRPAKQPLRIIVSRKGQFDFKHPVFHKEGGEIHLLSTGTPLKNPPPSISAHQMPLGTFLKYCKETLYIKTLLCEGGGELVRSLAELNVITDIHLTLAGHTLIGGAGSPGILGLLKTHLSKSQKFKLTYFEPFDNGECFLSYTTSS